MRLHHMEHTPHHLVMVVNVLYQQKKFQWYDKLNDMIPTSNQPARICASAKTHNFSSVDSVNVNDVKFWPIIDQTGMMTYNAAKVISDY